jgi:hypothetical protein
MCGGLVWSMYKWLSGLEGSNMSLLKRAKASVDYCEKLLNAGVDGGRSGWAASLHGKELIPFLSESARAAMSLIAIGACLGVLSSYLGDGHTLVPKALVSAFLGAGIGVAACITWGARRLLASVGSGALKSIGRVRDEHWLEGHPIDYA